MSLAANSDSEPGPKADQTVHLVDPIDRYSAFIVRGAIIGTGLFGLALFVRNSKLFATYQHVKQIPQDYYQKGIPLKGIVREVESNGILKVEHRPAFRLPKFMAPKRPKMPTNLNLRLAGIQVSPVGTEYLSKDFKLKGHPVTFAVIKPVEQQPDISDADVATKKAFRLVNLNVELVRKGFARVYSANDRPHMEALQFNTAYSRLITRLLTCEKVAERRGLGLWERSSWVERVQSYPSTAVQLVKHSTPTKLAILCYELLRDLFATLYFITKQLYYIGIELAKYAAIGYRVLSRGIDRAGIVYANAKRRLAQRKAIKIESVWTNSQPQSMERVEQHK